jgi:pimeloyl-ACP methyl ester carboxylesterase
LALAFADAIDRDGLEAAGALRVGPESGLDANAAKLVRLGFLEHAPRDRARCANCSRCSRVARRRGRSARLGVPTLVIAGERDPVSLRPAASSRRRSPARRCSSFPKPGTW